MTQCIVWILISALVATASAQAPGMGMSGMNMNFNLSTPEGILGFLRMENINPATLVTSNCVANGQSCSGAKPCCLNPVFSCQGSPGLCLVVPGHVDHLSEIRQIVQTAGVATQNPIL